MVCVCSTFFFFIILCKIYLHKIFTQSFFKQSLKYNHKSRKFLLVFMNVYECNIYIRVSVCFSNKMTFVTLYSFVYLSMKLNL